jgi:NNP family nitrate/nitrite transporter-like MFS transporter
MAHKLFVLLLCRVLQLAMLYPFCFFGQMACGAVFGIVPFLSHRRSGLTVGVVAAGGNVGAAVMQVRG